MQGCGLALLMRPRQLLMSSQQLQMAIVAWDYKNNAKPISSRSVSSLRWTNQRKRGLSGGTHLLRKEDVSDGTSRTKNDVKGWVRRKWVKEVGRCWNLDWIAMLRGQGLSDAP